MYTSANPPLVIHIFWPFRIQFLPIGGEHRARAECCASEPACGSEGNSSASHSPVASFGRYFLLLLLGAEINDGQRADARVRAVAHANDA